VAAHLVGLSAFQVFSILVCSLSQTVRYPSANFSFLLSQFLLFRELLSAFDLVLSACQLFSVCLGRFQHVSFSAFGLVISAFCFPSF
jgi:hypothetical protein